MNRQIGALLVLVVLGGMTTVASPVHVSYVYSESMEPTIAKYDGFLTVPAGSVETGDVVVFWSDPHGGYATHRVVGRSADGYVTRGDNNGQTDQATGHPYVQRDDVVGEVLLVDGEPLTVPHLGRLVRAIREHRSAVAVLAAVLVAAGSLGVGGRSGRRRARSIARVEDVVLPLVAVSVLASVALVFVGARTHDVSYVVVEGGLSGRGVIPVGEAVTRSLEYPSSTVPFTHRIPDTTGMSVTDVSMSADTVSADVRIPAQETTGVHVTQFRMYYYPLVLPPAVLDRFHAVHPLLAAGATVGVVFSPVVLAYKVLLDGRTPLRSGRAYRGLRRRTGRNR